MTGPRRLIGWLLLVLVAVLAAGGAALGVSQAPKQATLQDAVKNTLNAANYTSDVLESSPQGTQTQHLVYQAPSRLGGYVDSGTVRVYVAVIDSVEYQSNQVSPSASTAHLTFQKQASQPAASYDPVHEYVALAKNAKHVHQKGGTYTFTVTQQGQTASFTATVIGQYLSALTISASGAQLSLTISSVNSSPPVTLPGGAKVVSTPTTTAPTTAPTTTAPTTTAPTTTAPTTTTTG
ncbi:MAG TPA: hypothetical protein VND67_09440 [Acidimicrobiales bacterium]|nr:hypothetical protein [Acidimicrobiales bacterium]